MKHPLPILVLLLLVSLIGRAQTNATTIRIIRYAFTPGVIPYLSKQPVLLEVTTEGNPTEVRLSVGNTTEPEQVLNDRGTEGDKQANDGVFSGVIPPRAGAWLYPLVGYVRAYAGINRMAEAKCIATINLPETPAVKPQIIDSTSQYTNYVFNVVVPSTVRPLTESDRLKINQLFYKYHADEFDFINYVLTPGFTGPVSHTIVANNVTAIGLPIVNNSAAFGSKGRLKGILEFPVPDLFDGAGRPFVQAIGRQWIRPNNPLLAVGVPNWPLSNLATGVMGIGQEGTAFPFEFSSFGNEYILNSVSGSPSQSTRLSPTPRVNRTVFNEWELYLMGLLPPDQVETNAIVFKDQRTTIAPYGGGRYPKANFDVYSFAERVAEAGVRTPTAAQSQKQFSMATIILSERLLTAHELAHWEYMAKRAEGRHVVLTREELNYFDGRPFYLATNGRATLRTLLNTQVTCLQLPVQPTITASIGTSLCQGRMTVLTTSLPESLTPIWYHNGSPLPDRTNSITAVYAGDYALSVRDEKGCNSAVSPIMSLTTVVTPVKLSVFHTPDDVATSCSPGTLSTTRSLPAYQWFFDGKPIEGATKYIHYPRTTGAYSVAVQYPIGCTDIVSDPVSVTVRTNGRNVELAADKTELTCGGQPITLRATSDSRNPRAWVWYRNSDYLTQTTSATYSATATGTYTVHMLEEGYCPSSLSKPVSLTPNATPTKPTISTTTNGLQSSSPANNQWFSSGYPLYNATGAIYLTPYKGVTYTVQVNNGGCLIDSDPFLYEGVSITTAPQPETATSPPINTATAPQIITAYDPALPGSLNLRHAPNPVSQTARISFDLPITTHVTLRLLNSNGSAVRILAEGRYQAGTHTIMLDTSGLPSGLYLYRLEAEGVSRTNKLLVMK